jgi:hypothetical protein
MPARREISAREIGAPARIASSTVRSFRSFSNGGIAATRGMRKQTLPFSAAFPEISPET